jgi:DNA-binding NtrC family response regulator
MPVRQLLSGAFIEADYIRTEAGDEQESLEILAGGSYAPMLFDIKMPVLSGLETLALIREGYQDTADFITTANGDIQTAIDCMRRGAYDYISKPCHDQR